MTFDELRKQNPEIFRDPDFLVEYCRVLDHAAAKAHVREKVLSTGIRYFTTILDRSGVETDEHALRFIAIMGKALGLDRALEHAEADLEVLNHAFSDLVSQNPK